MNKRKKPVKIEILKTIDYYVIRITMFKKNKWIWIRRIETDLDKFIIAIMLMIGLLLAGFDIAIIVEYIKTGKEIIER